MATRVKQLAEEFWLFRITQKPEMAMSKGIIPVEPSLDEYSLRSYQDRLEFSKSLLFKLKTLDSEDLCEDDKVSLQMMVYYMNMVIEGEKYKEYLHPITPQEGPDMYFPRYCLNKLPFASTEDYEYYLKLLSLFPAQVSGFMSLMKEGIQQNVVHHKIAIVQALDRLKDLTRSNIEDCVFYSPFVQIPDSVINRDKLAEKGKIAIQTFIMEPMAQLLEFTKTEYFPHVRTELSIAKMPGPPGRYEAMLEYHCNTSLSPVELHKIGLREVEKIAKKMQEIMDQEGFSGSIREFREHIDARADQWFKSEEEMLQTCQDFLCKVKKILPKYFSHQPKTELEFKIDPVKAQVAKAIYINPSADGKVKGAVLMPQRSVKTLPKYEVPVLMAHEGEPGHHMQAAYALEMPDMPSFRKYKDERLYFEVPASYPMNSAYTEGWGLYCEELAEEMGLYEDHLARFGYCLYDIARSSRTVVDTGIHAMGWSREQAEAFMMEHTTLPHSSIAIEIDRHVCWPAQGASYKLGHLHIKTLRTKCEKELGDAFDIRDFHDACLSCGQVPLSILDEIIERYIKRVKAQPST